MSGVYDVGDLVKVFVTFTNPEGEATDPSTVTLVIRKPDGSTETVTSGFDHEDDSGYFSYDVPIDQAGLWAYRYEGAGDVTAVEPDAFYVRRPVAEEVGS